MKVKYMKDKQATNIKELNIKNIQKQNTLNVSNDFNFNQNSNFLKIQAIDQVSKIYIDLRPIDSKKKQFYDELKSYLGNYQPI